MNLNLKQSTMEYTLHLWQRFTLCALATLISGAIMQPPSSFAQAPGVPVEPRKLETILESLPQDVYERLDTLEKYQVYLEDLAKKHPQNAYVQALLGLTFFQLANTRNELGASAIDYWAYVSEVVDPLQSKAKKHFDAALASSDLVIAVRAWSHYYRGVLTSEYNPESTQSDYTKACELGYSKACQSLQESQK
jgi:hypothetical protein